jgi:hypothetical protein
MANVVLAAGEQSDAKTEEADGQARPL